MVLAVGRYCTAATFQISFNFSELGCFGFIGLVSFHFCHRFRLSVFANVYFKSPVICQWQNLIIRAYTVLAYWLVQSFDLPFSHRPKWVWPSCTFHLWVEPAPVSKTLCSVHNTSQQTRSRNAVILSWFVLSYHSTSTMTIFMQTKSHLFAAGRIVQEMRSHLKPSTCLWCTCGVIQGRNLISVRWVTCDTSWP